MSMIYTLIVRKGNQTRDITWFDTPFGLRTWLTRIMTTIGHEELVSIMNDLLDADIPNFVELEDVLDQIQHFLIMEVMDADMRFWFTPLELEAILTSRSNLQIFPELERIPKFAPWMAVDAERYFTYNEGTGEHTLQWIGFDMSRWINTHLIGDRRDVREHYRTWLGDFLTIAKMGRTCDSYEIR